MIKLNTYETNTSLLPNEINWEEALHNHAQWLKSVISLKVGEAAAVDEVWQEVSLAAIKQQSPLQDASRVAAWLYQLAVRQSLLYRRTMGRRRKLVDRYTDQVIPVSRDRSDKDPLELLLTDERHKQVRQALAALNEQDMEILLLKYVHEWNYNEMADNLGLTVSATQTRLHRARQRLRDNLADELFDDMLAKKRVDKYAS